MYCWPVIVGKGLFIVKMMKISNCFFHFSVLITSGSLPHIMSNNKFHQANLAMYLIRLIIHRT